MSNLDLPVSCKEINTFNQDMTKEELLAWGEDTVKLYNDIADQLGADKVPAFYTQSNLNHQIGIDAVDVFIAGINPGSDGRYQQMIDNPNWGINPTTGMTAEQLISGNFGITNGKKNWEYRYSWPYFQRLKGYFSLVDKDDLLDNEKHFVLTNASFFATCKESELPDSLRLKTVLQTIKLIQLTKPKRVVLLSGKKTFKLIAQAKNDEFSYKYNLKEPLATNVYYGEIDHIPCLGVPHPSARLSYIERDIIKKSIKLFMEKDNINYDEFKTIDITPANAVKPIRQNLSKEDIRDAFKQQADTIFNGQWNEPFRYEFTPGLQATFDKKSLNIRFSYRNSHDNYGIDFYPKEEVASITSILAKYDFGLPEKVWLGCIAYQKLGSSMTEIVSAIIGSLQSISQNINNHV